MKKTLFAVSLLTVLALSSYSSENVSLQILINTSQQNNPEIKSSKKTYQSAEYSIVKYKNNY